MIWLAGSVALAIVLAVLQLTPEQLSAVSLGVSSERWQVAAYLLLAGWLLLWLLPYVYRLFFNRPPIISRENQRKKRLFLSYRLLMLSVFWLALLLNAVAQRMFAIEQAVPKVLFVEATVRPVGLSDRRLLFQSTEPQQGANHRSPPSKNPQSNQKLTPKPKRLQGYRQLVTLHDIQPYTRQKNSTPQSSKASTSVNNHSFKSITPAKSTTPSTSSKPTEPSKPPKQQQQLNPLAVDTSELKHRLAADVTRQNDTSPRYQLPTTMTVMLSAYQSQLIALNRFAPDQQLRMQLQLTPIELLDEDSEGAFDEYRWLSSRHATAKAKVLSVELDSQQVRPSSLKLWIDSKRFELREHFLELVDKRSLAGVNMATQEAVLGDAFNQHKNSLSNISPDSHKVGSNSNVGKFNANINNNDSPNDNTNNSDNDNTNIHTHANNNTHIHVNNNQQITRATDAVAVTLSLLTGDRSLISPQMTDLYRFAGISHLLAISGTHVLFLAMLCAGLVTLLITRFAPSFYQFVPRWQCAFVISVGAAFGYALFAGFDVPAVRTACMLLVVGVLRYLLASASVFKVLLLLAVAMVWADVFVLWQAGFWLSFIAVAVLVIYSQRWEQGSKQQQVRQSGEQASMWRRLARSALGLFKLQMWMSVALLPISLWLFGQVSLWGFVVNLFAIGLFGWVIVPVNLLAGVLYAALPNHPEWADRLWSQLFWLLENLHQLLFALQASWQQVGWIYAKPSLALLLLLFLAALPWILPKGIFSRLLSVPPLMVIAVLGIHHQQQRQNMLHIQVLTPMKQDKKTPLSATLVWHQQQAWLLLSAYPKSTFLNKPLSIQKSAVLTTQTGSRLPQQSQPLWTAAQEQLHIQSLYDQIKQQHLTHLTGIIVQTATPQLASVVAHLTQILPTSYYWQAGLADNRRYIETQLAGTAMTAQGCHPGRMWQSGEDDVFKLTAETGWDKVASQFVWDCAINLTTTAEVRLPVSVQLPRLYDESQATVQRSVQGSKNVNTNAKTDAKTEDKAIAKMKRAQQFLFYSSNQPQLGRLWQLMCVAPSQTGFTLNLESNASNINSANANATKQLNVTKQLNDIKQLNDTEQLNDMEKLFAQNLSSAQHRHWLTSSQASIDKTLVTSRQPLSWHILDAEQIPATLKLKETQLYWRQQSQGLRHSPQPRLATDD